MKHINTGQGVWRCAFSGVSLQTASLSTLVAKNAQGTLGQCLLLVPLKVDARTILPKLLQSLLYIITEG